MQFPFLSNYPPTKVYTYNKMVISQKAKNIFNRFVSYCVGNKIGYHFVYFLDYNHKILKTKKFVEEKK